MWPCRNLYLNIINYSKIDQNPDECTGFDLYNYQTLVHFAKTDIGYTCIRKTE